MTSLNDLAANLTGAQAAYQGALTEIQAARAKADRAVRRHAKALQEQISERNPTENDVPAAQQAMTQALNELAAVETKYGL